MILALFYSNGTPMRTILIFFSAFISQEKGLLRDINTYQRADLRDIADHLVQHRGNSPINPDEFQDEILYRQEDNLKE